MHTTTTRGFFFATKFEAYARTRLPNKSTKYPRPGGNPHNPVKQPGSPHRQQPQSVAPPQGV